MEKNKFEKQLQQLIELDQRLTDNSDPDEALSDLNKIVSSLTRDIEMEVKKELSTPTLNYVNRSNNPDPEFAEEGDSGFDLRAFIPDFVIVRSGRVKTIPTGLYFEVEKGLEIQARSRSGLADKYNLFVLNSPGTIDSRYRGEVKIILANLGEDDFQVNNGDRIAQGVVCPVYGEGKLRLNKVEKLSESSRGTKGLGSSGLQ